MKSLTLLAIFLKELIERVTRWENQKFVTC
mgnify:CR=1 FL=1|jgi:hypothetical protein